MNRVYLKLKKYLAVILMVAITGGNLQIDNFMMYADAQEEMVDLYFVDDTKEQWIKNDNAVIDLIDNTHNHVHYEMIKQDDVTWKVQVPKSAYNITFNRYNSDKTTQWNSWSAGGRDSYNTYYADGSEYGHWDYTTNNAEHYFHEGDVIYLDFTEFTQWSQYNSLIFVNFNGASKAENSGKDINMENADTSIYNPQIVDCKVSDYVYAYTVTDEDEGAGELRFWRGNATTLWNYSSKLSYEQFMNGKNCVKVVDWNKSELSHSEEYVINYEKDTDEDGVVDYLEEYYGTDKNKKDTDGDGLSDYIEINKISLNPLDTDTDKNGINDGDEDADADGISNKRELEIGTDLTKSDTDSDKLNDNDEISIYGTDPLKMDTDDDGAADGREIELGTNPLVREENFNVNVTADCEDTVKASVETVLSGTQVESLKVEKVENELLFPEKMPGYVGDAYDFSVDGTFESATIKFEFNESLLENENFEPVIYYFNEEKQLLEELETNVIGNSATAEVTHFSKYILLNRKVFKESFTWQDVWDSKGYSGVEVVLVIDDSGSMISNDRANQRLSVAQNMIEKLPDKNKIGIVKFASSTSLLTTKLTDDKEQAKSFLTTDYFKSYGNTYMYGAINSAFSLFESTDDTVLRMIVVLSDGAASDTGLYTSVVNTANDKKVKIYTIGLGNSSSSYFTNYLKPLSSNTAGDFYLASDAAQLEGIFNDINKKIDIETDSDSDGIADYYEDNMVMFNGMTIKLDKNNPDSDGDGVSDGEEVAELNYQYNDDRTQVIVTGKLLSNPMEKDSDYDGRTDDKDAAPLNNHFTGKLKTDYAASNTNFDMDYRWFFNDNTIYNEDLSATSILFASAIYSGTSLKIQDSCKVGTTEGTCMSDIMNYFGLKNVKTISLDTIYNDNHLSEVGIGYRTVSYNGQLRNVIAVTVRGTNGTIEEWSSNFDIGNTSDFSSVSDWKTMNNHEGFDITANRIIKLVNEYVVENGLDKTDTAYWITGHSRGAAIANIIGAYYEKDGKNAYTYTYAAPNTTMASDAGSYRSIFNIVNADDFVPCLPMEGWGYTKYGRTADVSIANGYEKKWENLTGIFDYNPDTFGMQKTVDALTDIISSGDAREECYKYTCDCHGNDSSDNITITNYGTSKKSREGAIAKIPNNALPYCEITRYNGSWFWGWDFDVCQTPAYFMQVLAAKMSGDISNYRFVVELNVADRYENAKSKIISSAIGGLEHPHYTESYYVLAKNIEGGIFK